MSQEFYDKWDTTPVQALPPRQGKKGIEYLTERGTYQPDGYSGQEWSYRKNVERLGDDAWANSSALDMSEFDYL